MRWVPLALVGLLTATSLAPLPALAQESLAPGSVATNSAGESLLVRAAPGWDAEATGEVAPGSQVTVSDYATTAPDGSLWYPVAGGYVPASALTSGGTGGEMVEAAQEVPADQAAGYLDQNGNWVDTSGAAAPADQAAGYYDESGAWVDTSGAAAPVDQATGYYDETGAWVDTSGAAPTDQAAAAPVDQAAGYLDESGNWVDTSGAAAPAESATGYYDESGAWVDTSGAATEAAAPEAAAPVADTPTGYYDQNGAWVDTSGQNPSAANGTVVYDNASGASDASSATAPAAAPIGTAYVAGTNGDGAICRSAADWSAAELGTIPEGTAVEVTGGTVGEWQPVNCNGTSGYIHASFISWDEAAATDTATTAAEPAAETASAYRGGNNQNNRRGNSGGGSGQSIVNFASGYLGYPYVYAGAGPSGFDCSGFTMYVVQNTLGMDISHSVPTQYSMGTPVSQNQLQPGDLVFFENTFAPGLSHVGIYIGNGQFIHAENESTGVVISDLNSDYYSSHYYGAVRLA